MRHPNGDTFSLGNRFRGGDLVADTVGVLSFDFRYRIQPTAPADYTAVNPRPGTPEPVGGRLKVGAQDGTSPSGSTTLGLPGAQSFVSTGYDWLVVAGGQADLQGTGTLDGTPGYGFLLSVIDGGSPSADDRIRVVVWDADDGTVVYDSQPGDARTAAPTGQLTSGNVTIHKTK